MPQIKASIHFISKSILSATILISDSTIPIKDRAYYVHKSRKNRNTGFALIGAGSGLMAVGLLIGNRNSSSFDDAATGAVIGGLGFLTALGSIPCFISSSINKRKAMLSISSQKISPGVPLSTRSVTGISLNIPISK